MTDVLTSDICGAEQLGDLKIAGFGKNTILVPLFHASIACKVSPKLSKENCRTSFQF